MRKLQAKILRPLLSILPKKVGVVALTFHNVLANEYLWFENLIELLHSTYEFLDPNKIDDEHFVMGAKPKLLITFDDGFHSNRVLAETVLQKYGIKCLYFVTEDFINLSSEFCYEFVQNRLHPYSKLKNVDIEQLRAMTWEDVKWLVDKGHTIGSHAKTHINLFKLNSYNDIYDEVIGVADRIEDRVGAKINCFAFPFGGVGDVSPKIINLARTRFEFIFSNVRGNLAESPNKGFIFRQNIVPKDPVWMTQMMLDGRLDWKYRKNRNLSHQIFSI